MVTIENYEEYLMLAADGELDAAGKKALDAFLGTHPELADEALAWTSLRLQPDEKLVYEEKEALLRPAPKRIALGWRVTLAAAASILFAVVLISRQAHQDLPRFVHNIPANHPATIAKHTAAGPLPEKTLSHATLKRGAVAHQPAMKEEHLPLMRPREVLTALSSNPITRLETTPLQPSILTTTDVAVDALPVLNELPEASEAERQPFIRLAAANVPAVELLKEGMDARVAQISNTVKAIRETAIAVRIGNKNHYLNF